MQKYILLGFCLYYFSQTLVSQNIADLYTKEKYTAIVRLAEETDSAKNFSTLDLYQIGRSYYNIDDAQKALLYFQKALAAGRDSANVHYFIGVCYKDFKEYDKAMTAFDEALKRDSTDQYGWAEKGLVYYEQDSIKAAINAFETAVKMPYQYEYPYAVLLSLYILTKDFDKVQPFYEKWAKTIAKSERYHLNALKTMGGFEKTVKKDLPKALDYYEKALKLDALSMKNYEEVMKIHTLQKKWKKMDKVFEKLKTAYEDKRLNPEDLKRNATTVDDVPFNDTISVVSVRYFKKPQEFAEPIYKTYVVQTATDSTLMVILTEKSINFGDGKADNHMLCGWRGRTHYNFGMITRNGEVKFVDYKKQVLAILEEKIKPTASSTSGSKK